MTLIDDAKKEYQRWLTSPYVSDAVKNELYNIKDDNDKIISRFAIPMAFGTAGIRGVMASGIGRMNEYTVAQATYGVASVVLKSGGSKRGVAIAHDSRNNSRLFAETAASVLSYFGIKVYIFDSLRPTPELSFAVLHLNCQAGINVTASHNPKEYNGYKVYWEDGAQLPPDHAKTVSEGMQKVDVLNVPKTNFEEKVKDGTIIIIGREVDEKYLEKVAACSIRPEIVKKYGNTLDLMYTPLHGTGYRLVPEALKNAGIDNLIVVPSQAVIDGNFPTVASPNPENKECFDIAINMIKEKNLSTTVIIATDPDGDRLGVAVKQSDSSFMILNGNQIGVILVDYIIKAAKESGKLPKNAAAIRSVVSSPLFDEICIDGGVTPVTVLTGFKYIGEKIEEYSKTKENTFIFGFEESQGFLSGGYVRDKDAVAASLLIAEAASYYKSYGKTLSDALNEIYEKYGYRQELTVSVTIKSAVPMETMAKKMAEIRSSRISEFANEKVILRGDYVTGIMENFDGTTFPTGLPESDMLYYKTEKGNTVIIRPSGTEPKVKGYILVKGKNKAETSALIEKIKKEFCGFFD